MRVGDVRHEPGEELQRGDRLASGSIPSVALAPTPPGAAASLYAFTVSAQRKREAFVLRHRRCSMKYETVVVSVLAAALIGRGVAAHPAPLSRSERAVQAKDGTHPFSTTDTFGHHGRRSSLSSIDSTVIVFLGTGYPAPIPDQQGPATAVVVGSRLFLFDAGPGVVRQISAAGIQLVPASLTKIFITHLHSDHTLGLADLIFTSWEMGRIAPFEMYGPPGLQQMVAHLYEAYAEDIDIRTHGLEHRPAKGWPVNVHETQGGVVFDSAGVRVTAFKVPHGSWKWAFGYRIDTPSRSIVVSGDTRPSDELVREAQGVDVLVHTVYAESTGEPERGDTTNSYVRSFHTSDLQLGRLAARAKPKLLILTHIIRRGATDDQLIAGVHAGGFTGKVVVGKDLGRY
jgi:ribonuclease BN (tRNA processing enzyme)